MGTQFVVTPWGDSAELLELRKDLYGQIEDGAQDRRRWGVDKVFAWRSRKQGLPLLLDSTADIIDVILQDEQEKLSHNSLRLLYATAISRFITGLSDTQIDLSRDRPSWFPPGKTLQFPTSLLETRHCIVHRDLPSLFELKYAAKQALIWLWEWYWSHLDMAFARHGQEGGVLSQSELRDRCQTILKTYVKERKSEIKNKKKDEQAAARALSSYEFLAVSRSARQSAIVNQLIAEMAILPTDKKLGTSMSGAFLIWTPLLVSLNTHSSTFFHLLLDQLFEVMNKRGTGTLSVEADPASEGMYEWLFYILTSTKWTTMRRKGKSSSKNWSAAVAENNLLDGFLGQCLTSPTFWNLKLADALLKDGRAPNREQWLKVLEAAKSEGVIEGNGPVGAQIPDDGHMDLDITGEALSVGSKQKSDRERSMETNGLQKKIGLWKPTPIGALREAWEEDE